MGDVVSSKSYDSRKLSRELKTLVTEVNADLSHQTLSPYTITLGDEFQGVTKNLNTGIQTLFQFEETCLHRNYEFKLHYVLHYGEIETDINPKIAYEMMGSGLTMARELLSGKKRDRLRFNFELANITESEQLNRIFQVLDGITASWKVKDYPLIWDMIQNENNSKVGDLHQKNRDQIWKRRKTLMINEYNLLKSFILTYVK